MILAPMQGLTEVMFRRVYEECFPGAIEQAVSPFLSLTHGNLSDAWKKIDDVQPEANRGAMPVVPQILGKEPVEFIELGNRLYDIGYAEINWNMGCPMRKVAAKHRGSGILPHPDEVRAILDTIVPALHASLSIKMRIGLKSKEEIFALIPILNDYPLKSITIHPRLGRQQYTGQPDLATFAAALTLIHHPVVYNGDIVSAADARRIWQQLPSISNIMVGRGVLYHPTLPLEIAGSIERGSNEEKSLTRRFVGRLMEEIARCMPSDESRIRKTKEYWCLLWKGLNISEQQAFEVLHAQDINIVDKMIQKIIQ